MIGNGLKLLVIMVSVLIAGAVNAAEVSWIRINQLGYPSDGVKVAVLASKVKLNSGTFELIDANTSKSVYKNKSGNDFGAYGPFVATFRLDFSSFKKPG